MPTPDDLPPRLARVITRANRDIDALSARMESGGITVDQWRQEMETVISSQMNAALAAPLVGSSTGVGRAGGASEILQRLIQVQLDFLAGFASDIAATGWIPAYRSRAQMYGESVKAAYWNGDIYRQAKRFLPLPSMPAEGTICLTRCGCRWDIEEVAADRGDYDAYWRRGKQDSCGTCIERAAQWSPVRIRGGELLR